MADNNDHGHASNTDFFPPVEEKESGQKLLQFLERRLSFPPSLLHRWVRTGQIRINGRRCKPFARLAAGDIVRLPPFACNIARKENSASERATPDADLEIPAIIGRANGIIAINKPRGLAAQPGTGHSDCVCSRLAPLYASASFQPVPCHRLDRDTSGIMLVAESYSGLRAVQDALKAGTIHKEYLAWTHGNWPFQEPVLLRHFLRKEKSGEKTLMRVYAEPMPYAVEAQCVVKLALAKNGDSLLQIRLLTGRTHQIRAQLAHMGYPIIGDGKYGVRTGASIEINHGLLLHSYRLILPGGELFECPPEWEIYDFPAQNPPPLCAGFSQEDYSRLPINPLT